MTRMPIDSGRYALVETAGARQWVRDQVTLQADILALLEREGALPKKRIILTLNAAQAAIETALTTLLADGRIERYRAMSVRHRMDEHWCIAGQAPTPAQTSFRGMEILAGFQQAAARREGGVSA